jgi:hypothetical protein
MTRMEGVGPEGAQKHVHPTGERRATGTFLLIRAIRVMPALRFPTS